MNGEVLLMLFSTMCFGSCGRGGGRLAENAMF